MWSPRAYLKGPPGCCPFSLGTVIFGGNGPRKCSLSEFCVSWLWGIRWECPTLWSLQSKMVHQILAIEDSALLKLTDPGDGTRRLMTEERVSIFQTTKDDLVKVCIKTKSSCSAHLLDDFQTRETHGREGADTIEIWEDDQFCACAMAFAGGGFYFLFCYERRLQFEYMKRWRKIVIATLNGWRFVPASGLGFLNWIW